MTRKQRRRAVSGRAGGRNGRALSTASSAKKTNARGKPETGRLQRCASGSLNDFHNQNWTRMHSGAFGAPHELMALIVCTQEEVGELAASVLGVTGEKKRKAHLTNADVLDAVADAMTYLSLVASAVGCDDLEKLLGDTFNMVSDRAGTTIRTTLGQV